MGAFAANKALGAMNGYKRDPKASKWLWSGARPSTSSG